MFNSSLANYVNRTSGQFTSRPEPGLISAITIHTAHASGDIYKLSELLNSSYTAGYHYGIDTEGTIGLFVDECYRTYSTGNAENDNRAVNIICMNSSGDALSPITYQSLLNLVEDICRRNFIWKLVYNPTSPQTSTLTMHSQFGKADCPGSWIAAKYPEIANVVNSKLSAASKATSELESLKTQSVISVGATTPFIVTMKEGVTAGQVNYASLKQIGVVGAMFYAGTYFTSAHSVSRPYVNSHLADLVAEADRDNVPYALYCKVRCGNLKEAQWELNSLYYVISKYSPKLGIWMQLDTFASGNVLQEIVEKYYDSFVRWGLQKRCGVYCTRSMADKMNWTGWATRMAFWLDDELTGSISNLTELLTPSLFTY